MVSCEHEIRTEDATMIITDAFLVSFMRIIVGAQSVIQSRFGLRLNQGRKVGPLVW